VKIFEKKLLGRIFGRKWHLVKGDWGILSKVERREIFHSKSTHNWNDYVKEEVMGRAYFTNFG
jgi:hypothetical protein